MTADAIRYNPPRTSRKSFSAVTFELDTYALKPPERRFSLVQGARLQGRPHPHDTKARTATFLRLLADGTPPEQAARDAKISPWRALRIVTAPDFPDLVQALRRDNEAAA